MARKDRRQNPPESNAAAPVKKGLEFAFLLKFLGLLTVFFLMVAPRQVNDKVVEPFTHAIAVAGGTAVSLFGEPTEMNGTAIASKRFAVNIRNGCNGLETMFIFAAAVLAFPASWKTRLLGLAVGFVAIQLINMVRIVSLFYIGIHFPKLFEQSHVVIWQAIVILFGVALWILWAVKYALPARSGSAEATS